MVGLGVIGKTVDRDVCRRFYCCMAFASWP